MESGKWHLSGSEFILKNTKQFVSRHTRTLCMVFPQGSEQNYSSYTSLISKTFLLFANDTIIPGGGGYSNFWPQSEHTV